MSEPNLDQVQLTIQRKPQHQRDEDDDSDAHDVEDLRHIISPLPSPGVFYIDTPSSATSSDVSGIRDRDVFAENARLRIELNAMRRELERVQNTQENLNNKKNHPRHKVPSRRVLSDGEVKANRQTTTTPPRKAKRPKEHESGSEREDAGSDELEPNMDLDQYGGAKGLHHRRQQQDSTPPRTIFPLEILNGVKKGPVPYTVAESELLVGGDQEVLEEGKASTAELAADSSARPALASGNNNDAEDVDLDEPFWASVQDRAGWLVGLLVLQSMSSFIISRNESLLQEHIVIVQFLTMLVGAGGNAGNQASVRVIRGLATGSVNNDNRRRFLLVELKMGFMLSAIIGVAGCIRAAVFAVPLAETLAITTSLCSIVFISIVIGATLPLAMKYIGIDPAHSSTTIQVLMDILGVTITCHVSRSMLDSAFHAWLLGKS